MSACLDRDFGQYSSRRRKVWIVLMKQVPDSVCQNGPLRLSCWLAVEQLKALPDHTICRSDARAEP